MENKICTDIPKGTKLIETFGYFPDKGFQRLELHLDRLCYSAKAFGFEYDRMPIFERVTEMKAQTPKRCRLTLGVDGSFEFSVSDFDPTPVSWTVAIHPTRLCSDDVFLRYKTTQRSLYDNARQDLPTGIDEWLFLNEKEELCEGTITNLFLSRIDGGFDTPALSSGCLAGVLRQELINHSRASVKRISQAHLVKYENIFVGNSLRGLIPVELVSL